MIFIIKPWQENHGLDIYRNYMHNDDSNYSPAIDMHVTLEYKKLELFCSNNSLVPRRCDFDIEFEVFKQIIHTVNSLLERLSGEWIRVSFGGGST